MIICAACPSFLVRFVDGGGDGEDASRSPEVTQLRRRPTVSTDLSSYPSCGGSHPSSSLLSPPPPPPPLPPLFLLLLLGPPCDRVAVCVSGWFLFSLLSLSLPLFDFLSLCFLPWLLVSCLFWVEYGDSPSRALMWTWSLDRIRPVLRSISRTAVNICSGTGGRRTGSNQRHLPVRLINVDAPRRPVATGGIVQHFQCPRSIVEILIDY